MTDTAPQKPERVRTRGYQQEMLEESLRSNIIIALDTGSGKTHIAILRMKMEAEREAKKMSWFLAPTVTLCEQQKSVIQASLPVSVGYISGSMEPTQWKNPVIWQKILRTHRVMVSTPQVLLDALRHGYITMGRDINLIVFDEAHHAQGKHPYNEIMREFYFILDRRTTPGVQEFGSVRPMIMGLTASPIYGGNVVTAFKAIEKNLDSTIRAPIIHRPELDNFVHKPVFTHLTYDDHVPGFSTNLASLDNVERRLNIEDDPYVISLRKGLRNVVKGSAEWQKLDQQLSKALYKKDTFVHKGIRDFCLSAHYLLETIGTWSADWFVYTVVNAAKAAANPYDMMFSSWKSSEKKYLLKILDRISSTEVSMCEEDILDELAPKVTTLINSLLDQKFEEEARNEAFSGIIFVERRHAALALVEILRRHPFTKDAFRVGCLLGQSDSGHRHSLLDITRYMSKQEQKDTLREFRNGDKNLLVCTAVAEEGIDIQACGSVIRWDPPLNMASWAQSRGRARRRRSTFTLMFSKGGDGEVKVKQWEALENEMVRLYNDPSRLPLVRTDEDEDDDEYSNLEFRTKTGALLTPHSAIPHLAHFCALIPRTAHVDPRPLFALDPPDMPEGWHAVDPMLRPDPMPMGPPYGSTVTLPRCLHVPVREFTVPRIYQSKASAHRHAAFKAYMSLYEYGLLNESLLPDISVIERKDEELQAMLKDVEKRAGTANVSLQMNPWLPDDEIDCTADRTDLWWCSKLTIEGLLEFYLYTRREPAEISHEPIFLHHPIRGTIRVYLTDPQQVSGASEPIDDAREYTRNMFWCFNGSRMKWDQLDFAYLLLPCDTDSTWQERYEDVMNSEEHNRFTPEDEISVRADLFGEIFGYPDDITIVRKGIVNGRPYRFERWRTEDEPLTEEEEEELRRSYRYSDLDITYPLLVVQALPRRTNFLLPIKGESDEIPPIKYHLLLPEETRIPLLSPDELESSFLLPSILRAVAMFSTVTSLSRSLFTSSPLSVIPVTSLIPAITAPAAMERENYQRLETLGDTVLKFVTCLQLLAQYPHWHEGFLTRKKDHVVTNGNLAKANLKRKVYRWIIRDNLISKKWKPIYESTFGEILPLETDQQKDEDDENEGKDDDKKYKRKGKYPKKKRKKTQELSTKVLADVIESLIGAAYVYGGLDLGFECINHFKLGMTLAPLDKRIDEMLGRVGTLENVPLQLSTVEEMIGYTFQHKLLLVEALAHASYESDIDTPSYERMEFLGDSVLDMVVTDYLYNAPGKKYSPGHIHLRRSAVVNMHFLAYLCLCTFTKVETEMPQMDIRSWTLGSVTTSQEVYLWKCILHSSTRILDDQSKTFDSFVKWRRSIESDLGQGKIFPWAALTRLQAPKFFSDIVESIIGAVYLDSRGDLSPSGAVQRVMRRLGILDVLEWIVRDDVDILHPVSRVYQWAKKRGKEVEYRYEKEKGTIGCTILLDGEEVMVTRDQVPVLNEVASVSIIGPKVANGGTGTNGELEEEELVVLKAIDLHRGKVSEGEVKFAVAEAAIKVFNLRGADEDAMIWKKNPPRRKKDKGKGKEV